MLTSRSSTYLDALQTLREEVLSIWFQTIVAPPETWTIEHALTAQLLRLDADAPGGSLFAVVPFVRRADADTDEDGVGADGGGEYDISLDDLRRKRGALLDGSSPIPFAAPSSTASVLLTPPLSPQPDSTRPART